jgi:hypothetical protein
MHIHITPVVCRVIPTYYLSTYLVTRRNMMVLQTPGRLRITDRALKEGDCSGRVAPN